MSMHMTIRQVLSQRKGFTLVETIVAVGIIVLMITVPVSGYIRSSQMIREEMNDLTAGYLQQEAIELMKMTIRAEGDASIIDALFLFSSYDSALGTEVPRGYYLARCSGICDDEKLADEREGDEGMNGLKRNLSLELHDTKVGAFCIKTFDPIVINADDSDGTNNFYDAVRLTSSTTWVSRKANLPELSTAMYRPFLIECK